MPLRERQRVGRPGHGDDGTHGHAGAAAELPQLRTPGYDEGIVRLFVIATMFWGIVGFSMGVIIALQLAYPGLNPDLPWFHFGRLRPVHTSAVIFAFGGNALIGTSLHVVQRTCRAPCSAGPPGPLPVLGLPAVHRPGGVGLRPGRHPEPRICRARVVRRPLADPRLGRLPGHHDGHDRAAPGAAHLRVALVLPRLHHHDRRPAHCQQPGRAGLLLRCEELFRLSPASRTR